MKLSRERAEQLAFEYVDKDKNENFKLVLLGVEVSKISPQYWTATLRLEFQKGILWKVLY